MRYLVLTLALAAGSIAFAEDDLNSRLQKLESTLEQLRSEKTVWDGPGPLLTINNSRTQLGPAASKIYFAPEASWTLGLSSELFSFQKAEDSRANVMNVAPVLAFRTHRRLIFNSQFLFENGGSESRNTITYQKGQSVVQMAYLDWLLNDEGDVGLRVGHQLIPIGLTNTSGEPVNYLSVLRPELERELIPGSWHENGLSLWVDRPRADIQIGLFNSLEAVTFAAKLSLAEDATRVKMQKQMT